MFTVGDLKELLEKYPNDMPIEVDVLYNDKYVLTDISPYYDTLVIECGYKNDVKKSVVK